MSDLFFHECFMSDEGQINMAIDLSDYHVKDATVFCGINRRNIESHLKKQHFLKVSKTLMEFDSYCGSPNNMAYAFILAYEKSIEESAPPNAQAMRMTIVELSRIYTHTKAIIKILNAIQWTSMADDTYKILYLLKKIMSQIHKDYPLMPLGFHHTFSPDLMDKVLSFSNFLKQSLLKIQQKVLRSPFFKLRTVEVGVLSRPDCLSYGVSGISLRSAGVLHDHRQLDPYDLYAHVDFSIPIGSVGDSYERSALRFSECLESVNIIQQTLSFITPGGTSFSPQGQYFLSKTPVTGSALFQIKANYVKEKGLLAKYSQLSSFIEGPRGRSHFFARINQHHHLENISFKYGSYFNAQLMTFLMRNCAPEDINVIVASLDVSPKELDH